MIRKQALLWLGVLALPAAGYFARSAAPSLPSAEAGDPAARGRYLVNSMACADCHTPWKMGENGPEPDGTRALSGHPESLAMPPAPAASGPWIASMAATHTAWAGPWGVSFPANLTPDPETGLGKWTKENFVQAIRTERHMGRGRRILPPMPAFAFAQLNDEDLGSIYAYLRTIPPVKNRVPDPVPPAEAPTPAPAGEAAK